MKSQEPFNNKLFKSQQSNFLNLLKSTRIKIPSICWNVNWLCENWVWLPGIQTSRKYVETCQTSNLKTSLIFINSSRQSESTLITWNKLQNESNWKKRQMRTVQKQSWIKFAWCFENYWGTWRQYSSSSGFYFNGIGKCLFW